MAQAVIEGKGDTTKYPEILMNQLIQPLKDKKRRIEDIVRNSYSGESSVGWLKYAPIDKSAREYQREKVADDNWKQQLMESVVEKILGVGIVIMNTIHIRIVVKDNGEITFELIDGQQRVTSILDFIENKYVLAEGFKVGDLDLGGLEYKDLIAKGGEYKEIADGILNYEINTAFYEGLTDQDTSDLFINKLNNVNDMNWQEKRQAIIGGLSRWIRNTSRIKKSDGGDRHELFTTLVDEDKGIPKMVYFNLKVKDQRMERDQWLANLTYLSLVEGGYTTGIAGQKNITKFYEDNQLGSGKYKKSFTNSSVITRLLNLGLDICKTTPDMYTSKLSPMNLMMMILYARDLQKRFGKINLDKFVVSWFEMATEWSDTKKALYKDLYEANGKTPMKPFWDNFNGSNSNAIKTIKMVADDNMPNVGIEIDTRDFTKKQIEDKLIAQGGLDFWTLKPLKSSNAVGDHYIPRSAGVEQGGVTEWENLVITSNYNNRTKSNMTPEMFQAQMEKLQMKIAS
jgi:hypothetical protein